MWATSCGAGVEVLDYNPLQITMVSQTVKYKETYLHTYALGKPDLPAVAATWMDSEALAIDHSVV